MGHQEEIMNHGFHDYTEQKGFKQKLPNGMTETVWAEAVLQGWIPANAGMTG